MPQKSLLLVDDEPLIRESLARELASATLAVTVAASGEEAVARLGREWFDVVVSDLVMPGLDGFQVLKAAKSRDRAIAVILLTGFGDMDTAIDALRLGADDFLRKPCEVDELCWRIGNCQKKQELQRKVAFYERVLPVCSYCGKIRHDRPGEHGRGPWYELEEYLRRAKGVNLSHGCCPECFGQAAADLGPVATGTGGAVDADTPEAAS